MSDYDALLNGIWITDNIVNAGQIIIKYTFPHICGLQNILPVMNLQFDVQLTEFVQILHIDGNHWITISTIGCKVGEVNLYDCNQCESLSASTEEQMSCLLNSKEKELHVKIMPVQRQKGCSDCGLFALAFAATLCSGSCPSNMVYKQSSMRKHLLDCFLHFSMTIFAGRKITRPSKRACSEVIIDLFCKCTCRQPKYGLMAQCDKCKEWFHENCKSISTTVRCPIQIGFVLHARIHFINKHYFFASFIYFLHYSFTSISDYMNRESKCASAVTS